MFDNFLYICRFDPHSKTRRFSKSVATASIFVSFLSCVAGFVAAHTFGLSSQYFMATTSVFFGCVVALAVDAFAFYRLKLSRSQRVVLLVLGAIYGGVAFVVVLSWISVLGVFFLLRDAEFPSPN